MSFISLTLVLPPVLSVLRAGTDLIALVKPQFEGAPSKKGIVRDSADRDAAFARVKACLEALGWPVAGRMTSPIAGGDGNIEILLHAARHTP